MVVVAVSTQDLVTVGEEASPNQRDGAAGALEAGLVPLTILERNILPLAKPCNGRVTGGTLLCVDAAEALDAVGRVSLGGEGLAGQWDLASCAHETLFVPRLILVAHTPCCQCLFAVAASRGEPALVARYTVVVVFVWNERLGTDGLLTAMAHKAVLVPCRALILQLL